MPAVKSKPQQRGQLRATGRKTLPTEIRTGVTETGPPPSRRRGFTPLTPMRHETAKSLRKLAAHVQGTHPGAIVHQHLRDAAKVLESGNEEGAQRHLRAAVHALTPQSMMRQGLHTDGAHIAARQAMDGVHRHLLLVKDIVDVAAKNQAAIRRDSYGDLESAPTLPHPPFRPDPNAGYGPGALAQKPTARQPGGDSALNAPSRTNSGGSDPAVADPVGPQPKGSKQFARTWDDLASVIDLVGPKGYEHGWHFVGVPGSPQHGYAAASHLTMESQTAKRLHDAVKGMSGSDLKAAGREFARQAGLLGKAGQVSRTHKAVRAELAARKTAGKAVAAEVPAAKKALVKPAAAKAPAKAQQAQAMDRALQFWVKSKKNAQARVAAQASLAGEATWDDLASVVELSAETGRLAVTPAPYGKPGGPGLYGVHGLKHSDYLEQIVHALMTKRGMDKGRATAIARGAIRKWMRGGGKVHPEVRAAAAGAEAEELKAQARAHAHANTWGELDAVIDLACQPIDLVGPHGFIHGWIYVGGPGLPSVAAHNAALKAKGVTPPTKAHPALTSKPPGVKPPAKTAVQAGLRRRSGARYQGHPPRQRHRQSSQRRREPCSRQDA